MTDYIVSGAGTAAVNGTYTDQGIGADGIHHDYAFGSAYKIIYSASITRWLLEDASSPFNTYYLLFGSGNPDSGSWTTNTANASDPPPTVMAVTTPAPTASLSPASQTIVQGQSATMGITTTNATSASIDQDVGSVAVNGSVAVSPQVTTTYTLTATGAGGSTTVTATVVVRSPRRRACGCGS